jgi:hypothetical protein
LIRWTAANIEPLDDRRGRHPVGHVQQRSIGHIKPGRAAKLQAEPLDDGQCLEACRTGGLEDMGERLIDGRTRAPSGIRLIGALIWTPDRRGVSARANMRARFCSKASSISPRAGPA